MTVKDTEALREAITPLVYAAYKQILITKGVPKSSLPTFEQFELFNLIGIEQMRDYALDKIWELVNWYVEATGDVGHAARMKIWIDDEFGGEKTMDEEKSRLQGFRVAELLITKTLVGKGVDGSPIRNLFQIWTEDSMLIATVDHGDNAYSVIESIFRGGHEK